ncbi:MAG: tetratricopeptide repeat protein [Chitinophagia bacterium]|nr:tetratricopeptide repeat protein [Chitinophagia bacterium]
MKRYWILIFLGWGLACKEPPENVKKVTTLTEASSPEVIRQLNQINQYPDSASLRVEAIETFDSLGKLSLALTQIDELIKRDSLHAGYWTKKGEIHEKLGDTSGALRCYRFASRIYPNPDMMLRIANLMAEQKNDTALFILKSISNEWKDRTYQSHVSFIKGVYYARKGQSALAHQWLNQCIAINYHYLEAYMEKGFLFWDAGNYAGAKKIFETVIQLKSIYPDGYYWLAKTEAALRDTAQAVAHYRQAIQLDPSIQIPDFAALR